MHHLLRARERESLVLNRLWRPLIGFVAIGLGLLGVVVHQLGVAPVPYGLSLAIAGAGVLFVLRHEQTAGRIALPTISERSLVWFSLANLAMTNVALVLSFHVERRPILVFFLTAVQAGSITVQVLLAPYSSRNTRFLLRIQIILLHIGIILGRLLVFPEIGVDIWPQEFFAREIVTEGHFPLADTAYRGYPFWPALAGVLAIFTGRPEQEAILLTALAFSSVALWILLVGLEHLFGHRDSLLIGLILSVSNWFVYWASLAVPMIVTVALFNTVLVLLFQRRHELWLSLTVCLLMLLGAGAFYHPMANVASSLLLVTTALVMWYLARRGVEKKPSSLSAQARWATIGALVAVVLTLSVWMYLGKTFDHLTLVAYHSIQQIEPLSFRGSYRSTLVYELDYVGFHLLLLLAVARFLRWWVRPVKSPLEITLLSGSFVFLGLNYLAIVTDAFFALPHRWLVYASVLLSIPAAAELRSIAHTRVLGVVLSSLIVMTLTFTAITNTSVNEDNPLYGADVAFKQSLTASETAVLEFIDRHRVSRTAVDWQVWNYFRALEDLGLRPDGSLDQFLMYYETDTRGMCPDLPSTLPEAALLRQVYLNRRIGWTTCIVELSGLTELERAREFAKVYDSGEASFYRRVTMSVAPGSQK